MVEVAGMAHYRVLATDEFDEEFQNLDAFNRKRVERFLEQLQQFPSMVGQPLGFTFFREKKFNGHRMYYLVYEEWKAVLAVGFSGKKDQSIIIAKIRNNFYHYKQFVWKQIESPQTF